MEVNFDNNSIVIFGKKAKLDGVISKFVQLNGDQLSHFLKNRAIKVPRRLHLLALMKVLNRKVKELRSTSLSADYFIRLQYYKDFTEEQYAILFDKIAKDDKEAFLEYRYNFVKLLFLNNVALDFNDGEINYIRSISKEKMESFVKYSWLVDQACVDQEGYFDGVLIKDAKKNLVNTAPVHEIRKIGKKYGVVVPERLNKDLFLEYIKDYLGKKMSEKDFESLSNMSLNQINEFCTKLKIEMSAQLTKSEAVTYMFYLLDKVKLEKSSIKSLVVPKEGYTPLDFTVDLDLVDPFGKNEPKKIIHYEGEEEEDEAEKIVLTEDDYTAEAPEAPKFTVSFDNMEHGDKPDDVADLELMPDYFPVLTDEKFDFVGWFLDKEYKMEVTPHEKLEANVTLYAKWIQKEEDLDITSKELNEEIAKEEVKTEDSLAPVIEAKEEKVEEVKEEKVEELKEEKPLDNEPNLLEDTTISKNEFYGSAKISKSGKSKAKLIALLIFLALLLGALIYIVIILLI